MPEGNQHRCAARFERFGVDCAEHGSPFYGQLSKLVATDEDLLRIAAHASREPIPNVFFGAVHYLLLKGKEHELREFYSTTTGAQPRDDDALFDVFSNFCSLYRDELIGLVSTRLVQTNEVNRCAILAPAFSVVYEAGHRRPLSLVEIGSSAGLNLLWDRYRISYSDGSFLGDPTSTVQIECENRGASLSMDGCPGPVIADRVGIDLHPIDLHDLSERLWLRALVWPDQRRRAFRLDAAIALALQDLPVVIRGDVLTVLPDILRGIPDPSTLCVYHSSVLYQFSPEEREQLASILARASMDRPVMQVSAESEEGLRLLVYRNGTRVEERSLGSFDTHGRWLCWGR